MIIPPELLNLAPKHLMYILFFQQFTIQKPYLAIKLTDVPIKLENMISQNNKLLGLFIFMFLQIPPSCLLKCQSVTYKVYNNE